jgi:GH18 family chitinase
MIFSGAPRDKLVMGLPIYGRGFQLNNTADNGLYCPAKDGKFCGDQRDLRPVF